MTGQLCVGALPRIEFAGPAFSGSIEQKVRDPATPLDDDRRVYVVDLGAERSEDIREDSGRAVELVDEVLEIGARATYGIDVLEILRNGALIVTLGDGHKSGLIEDEQANRIVDQLKGVRPR